MVRTQMDYPYKGIFLLLLTEVLWQEIFLKGKITEQNFATENTNA